ncbi:S8 family peptidase [Flavobacterium degerlachei]|jgi:subtilisin family serine protease|uniref:Por secretion system C-terminal sorting domain-containing protein n=1 Tax=Flavobacterium degerlachei TaxID=229203 RepID=A0A1H2T9L9_9FLAO|nr:S8 family serine peptidase [Flavobacterium degerlachei]SDW39984.1 Por secretion system C-terminal sorting domain-containing protein [Flavobacterium degerlachei]
MKQVFLFFYLFLTTIAFSQEDAWVYFNAKNNSQFYFDSPLEMLSQRALDRRTNQSIAIDLKDIPIDKSYISQIKLASGITVMAKSKWLNAIHVRGTQTAINSLKTFAFVDNIDFANKTLNQTGKTAKTFKINEQSKTKKTKIDYAYGTSANQIQMLNGDVLHQKNYTGSGKIIAIMDAGFPGVNTVQPFQRLRDNKQILGGYDYVSRNTDFYTGSSHGTLVLSSIGGYKENSLVGTAPDASYYLFITEDDAAENPIEESLWVEAAEKADSLGVDIINTSLGYFEYDNTAYSHSYADMNGTTNFISRGAEIAFSRGIIVVTSAGNEGTTSQPHIGAPADAVSVLSIGAVNSGKTRASFSSIGPSYDNRIKPDVMAQGASAVLSDQFGNIITANGTSFSSPIMAGMVACLWQAFPNKTNKEIRQLIIESADRFSVPDSQYGYGIPDFSLALNKTLFVDDFSKKYFVAYPNPTTDLISVSFPESFNTGKVIFYTILGKKVLERSISNQSDTFSLKSLSNGIYFYKIEVDAFSKSGKIIKQ